MVLKYLPLKKWGLSGKLSGLKSGPLSGPDNNLYEIYNCKYCNKLFKHKSNKSRHEKSRCTKRNYNTNNILYTNNNNVTYTQEDFEREVNKKAEKKIKEVKKEAEEKAEVFADKRAQKDGSQFNR